MDIRATKPHPQSLFFLHHIRLVPLFSAILGGILLLFALSAGLASYFLLQADTGQRSMTEELAVQSGLSDSANLLRSARINMIHAGAASRIAEMDEMKRNIADAEQQINLARQGFQRYIGRAVKTPADEALDAQITARFQAYIDGLKPMMKYAKNGMFEAIINHENEHARQLDDAYTAELNKVIEIRSDRARELTNSGHRRTQFGIGIMVAAFVLAAAMSLLTFFALRTVVIAPLRRALARIEQIGDGNLTLAEEPTGRSEIGRLSRGLQNMQGALAATVEAVRQGADEIFRGTGEISAGNSDLSSRTEQQAAAIEETAASMEQLTATVKQNADNAHRASALAKDASGKATHGGDMVAGVVATMGNISDSSRKISEITAVINSIAFQTNILALNAAVEAARAGEQGRGFAVVASEVRNLASRSAQAAKEIEGLIGESVGLIERGSKEVSAAGGTMSEIVAAVGRVSAIMLEIAAASDEQSRGIEQVSQAVTEMDNVTQQNASLVEEAAAAAASLEAQAAALTGAVGAFRLQQRQARPQPDPVSSPAKAVLAQDGGWETF
ncbi:methyl-accepting chemotaxis protein [Pluralibacter gergoviae]|uniref:methyl-accepting chemotaxis protein n=1 Tax=Pluralibacter gergoviae TaxID=61647 RepID=UPI003EE02B63